MIADLFPRTRRYDPAWVEAHSLGENVLWFTESLCEVMALQLGMRVLDLGCGHAVSSIFLAREFGVTVFAVDRGIDPSANWRRACAMDVGELVVPVRAEARNLPFPHAYFDAVVAIDCWHAFGTDDRFLHFLCPHVKPGGHVGVVDACTSREINILADLPPDLQDAWRRG
jgi:cyclopropane fatty-acyl-phospholipid synthase-like methyltransferase